MIGLIRKLERWLVIIISYCVTNNIIVMYNNVCVPGVAGLVARGNAASVCKCGGAALSVHAAAAGGALSAQTS